MARAALILALLFAGSLSAATLELRVYERERVVPELSRERANASEADWRRVALQAVNAGKAGGPYRLELRLMQDGGGFVRPMLGRTEASGVDAAGVRRVQEALR